MGSLTTPSPQHEMPPVTKVQMGCRMMQSTMEAQYEAMGSMTTPPPQQAAFTDAASMQRQMLTWQMQQLRPVRPAQLQLTYNSRDNPVAQYQDAPPNPMVSNAWPPNPMVSNAWPPNPVVSNVQTCIEQCPAC